MEIIRKIKAINKLLKIIVFHLIVFVTLLVSKTDLTKIIVLQDDFIITFLLTLLGLFLAIITLLYGLIEKIATAFNKVKINSMKHIHKSLDELKENTFFIFYALILCIILSIWLNCDIPYIISPYFINKTFLLFDLKIMILSFSLISAHDTVQTLFTILNISRKAN